MRVSSVMLNNRCNESNEVCKAHAIIVTRIRNVKIMEILERRERLGSDNARQRTARQENKTRHGLSMVLA